MSQGGKPSIYAQLPVKRACSCPVPVIYADEDGDKVCFRCGQRVKKAAVARP